LGTFCDCDELHKIVDVVAPDLRGMDVVMLTCDNYNTFCCGQNEAARQYCLRNNGTLRMPAGNEVFPAANKATLTITSFVTTTATGGTSTATFAPSSSSTNKTTIGVGVGLGAVLLVVSVFLFVTVRRLIRLDKELRRLAGKRVDADNENRHWF